MANLLNNPDIPIGLGMAFAQDIEAMNRFSRLPESEKKKFLDRARRTKSHEEMADLVRSL